MQQLECTSKQKCIKNEKGLCTYNGWCIYQNLILKQQKEEEIEINQFSAEQR